MTAFVHSNFERAEGDHYPTIDARCVPALLESWDIPQSIWEPCAPSVSPLATALESSSREVWSSEDALKDRLPNRAIRAVVTNPPYSRPLVDQIVRRFVGMVADPNEPLVVAAFLMRLAWDSAVTRSDIFDNP